MIPFVFLFVGPVAAVWVQRRCSRSCLTLPHTIWVVWCVPASPFYWAAHIPRQETLLWALVCEAYDPSSVATTVPADTAAATPPADAESTMSDIDRDLLDMLLARFSAVADSEHGHDNDGEREGTVGAAGARTSLWLLPRELLVAGGTCSGGCVDSAYLLMLLFVVAVQSNMMFVFCRAWVAVIEARLAKVLDTLATTPGYVILLFIQQSCTLRVDLAVRPCVVILRLVGRRSTLP